MSENSPRIRERRTAYFIVAVMFLALFWFASQAGWFSGGTEESATVAPEHSPVKNITQRRGLILPIMEFSTLHERLDTRAAGTLRENGINWLMIHMPVWTPSPRRFEYDGFDLAHLSEIIANAHAAGMGVTLAPVYWDGKALHPIPPVPVNATLFGQYRDMLMDFAGTAAKSKADALLLDGLFGSTNVSAMEWTTLLEELRTLYSGRIEGRMDKGLTPAIYINALDGASVALTGSTETSSLGNMLDAILVAYPDKEATLIMPDPDRYSAREMPWRPVYAASADAIKRAEDFLSSPEIISDECDGFYITGSGVYEVLSSVSGSETPLSKKLDMLREESLRRVLEKGRREQTITQ